MCKFFIKFMSYTVLLIYGCFFFVVTILIISKYLVFPFNSVHWQIDIRNETYVTFSSIGGLYRPEVPSLFYIKSRGQGIFRWAVKIHLLV